MDIIKVKVTIEDPDTGEERVIINDKYRNIAYLAEDYGNKSKVAEVLVHTSISNLALDIAGSEKFKEATKLATVFGRVINGMRNSAEDSLISQIEESMGGMQ